MNSLFINPNKILSLSLRPSLILNLIKGLNELMVICRNLINIRLKQTTNIHEEKLYEFTKQKFTIWMHRDRPNINNYTTVQPKQRFKNLVFGNFVVRQQAKLVVSTPPYANPQWRPPPSRDMIPLGKSKYSEFWILVSNDFFPM